MVPYLSLLEYKFIDVKSLGFFNTGNFKSEMSLVMSKNGKTNMSIYKKLIYINKEGIEKETSVKIDTSLLMLTGVYYCPEIE